MGILQGEPNMKVRTIIRTIEVLYQGYVITYGKSWRPKQRVSEIWARGTCTTCVSNHHQAIGLAAVKGRPARADAVNQCGDQGKSRQAYLDDSYDQSIVTN
jgi:hypothetical protein